MVYRIGILLFLVGAPVSLIAEEVHFDGDCLPCVVDFLKGTRKELKAAVFDINEPSIVEALQNLYWSGKDIQILSDRRQAGGKYSRVVDLYLLGMNVRLNSKRNLQHNKFAVRDGRASVAGSFNWTRGASNRNSEDVTLLRKSFFGGQVNGMINDYQDKFDEDWTKNTQEKSDVYFQKIIDKNRTEILERWKPWIHNTFDFQSSWSRVGSSRIGSALSLVEKLRYYPPKILSTLERAARGKLGKANQVEAIRVLGQSNTTSLSAHRTLVEMSQYGAPPVREAAEQAMAHLGKKLRIDPATYWSGLFGNIRAFRARCGQVLRFLSPW